LDAPPSPGAPEGRLDEPTPPAASGQPADEVAPGGSGNNLSLVDVRRLWPDIVDATKLKRRVTWIHLTQHAQVVAVDAKTLTLGFGNAGARESFVNGGSPEIVRQAAIDVVGADWRVEAIVDPGARADVPPPAAAAPADPGPEAPAAPPAADPPPPAPAPPAPTATASAEVVSAAREAIAPIRTPGSAAESAPRVDLDADAHPDDPDIESSGLAGAELLQRELGAQIIHEIKHD